MKKIITIIIIFMLISVMLSTMFLFNKEAHIYNSKEMVRKSLISMMVEQNDGTYKEDNGIELVNDGYMFNSNKSGCEGLGKLTWNKEKEKIEADLLTSDKCYAYFDKYNFEKSCISGYENNLECDILKGKDNSLIFHDGKADYSEEENYLLEAGDYSYRYMGANPNNYVCFGGDCSNSTTNSNYSNLYRIIGLFDDNEDGYYNLKIIKADYATEKELGTGGAYAGKFSEVGSIDKSPGSYKGDITNFFKMVGSFRWASDNADSSLWSNSELNTINLNNYFVNTYLGNGTYNINNNPNKWQQMIDKHTWIIGGNNINNIMRNYDSKKAYDYEVKENLAKNAVVNAYVGLIYISDFRYSAPQKYWNLVGNDGQPGASSHDYRTSKGDNWLTLGLYEWTITRRTDASATYRIDHVGCVGEGPKNNNHTVRPVMYLKHNIKRISGDGTSNNPYQITI